MKKINATIVYGCNGCCVDNFTYCNGVSNEITNLQDLDDYQYDKICTFLDNCGMFDDVIEDSNSVSNVLNLLRKDYNVIDDKALHNIQGFHRMHFKCKFYLYLKLGE